MTLRTYILLFSLKFLLSLGLAAQEWKLVGTIGGWPDSAMIDPQVMYFEENAIIVYDEASYNYKEYDYKGGFVREISLPGIYDAESGSLSSGGGELGPRNVHPFKGNMYAIHKNNLLIYPQDSTKLRHSYPQKMAKFSNYFFGRETILMNINNKIVAVLDSNSRSNTAAILDTNGKILRKFTIVFKYLPCNNQVRKMDYDSKENMYFQNYTGEIAVHDSTGKYLKAIESWGNVRWGAFCIDEKDRVYAIKNNELYVLNKRGVKQYSQYLRNVNPINLFSDRKGGIYIVNDNKNGTNFIYKYNSNADYLGTFGKYLPYHIHEPQGLFVDEKENIYVTDIEQVYYIQERDFSLERSRHYTENYRVQKFDKNLLLQKKVSFFRTPVLIQSDTLTIPYSVTNISVPNIYIDKSENAHLVYSWEDDFNLVKVFNMKGTLIEKYAKSSKKEILDHSAPYPIAIDSLGNTYIAERDFHRVLVLNKEKQQINTFGKAGLCDSCLLYPHAMTTDSQHNILILDQSPYIKQFDKNGIFKRAICLDSNDLVSFYDFWKNTPLDIGYKRKQNYSKEEYQAYWGIWIGKRRHFSAITADGEDNIYLTNHKTSMISILDKDFHKKEEIINYKENDMDRYGYFVNIHVKNGKIICDRLRI